MFYEEDGEIYPALITSDYYEMNKDLTILYIFRFYLIRIL